MDSTLRISLVYFISTLSGGTQDADAIQEHIQMSLPKCPRKASNDAFMHQIIKTLI